MLHIKIKSLRENHELTQKQVADFLNIERSTYAYYESGKNLPSAPMIARLSELYSVSCDYLIKDDIKCKRISNRENLLNMTHKKKL